MKATYTLVTLCLLFHLALADIYNQLQFMKILSPTNGQSIQAGENVTIKYVMQPLVYSNLHYTLYTLVLIYIFNYRTCIKWVCKEYRHQLS